MGRFRWVTKPFKRWAFAKGVEITNRCCRLFSTKYIVKMIRYVEKDVPAVLPRHLGNEPPKPGQLLPTHKMDHRQSIRLADQLTDLLMPAAGMPPRDASRPLRATLEEAIALALISSDKAPGGAGMLPGALGAIGAIGSIGAIGAIGVVSCAAEAPPGAQQAHLQPPGGIVLDLAEYAEGLGKAIDSNRGLDHSKVREYWLQRGPRLFLTAAGYFVFTVVLSETLRDNTPRDRTYSLLVNTSALLVALALLFFRLHDSIKGAISRSAHTHYITWKKARKKARKGARSHVLESAAGAGVDTSEQSERINSPPSLGAVIDP